MGEQRLLAGNFDGGGGGRQPAGQDEQQPGCGTADGDVGFAVAAGDRDAGRCPGDQPLTGTGQSGAGGVKMQALAVSARVLCPGRIRGAPGAGGGEPGPLVDAVRGSLRGQIDVASRRELSVVGITPGAYQATEALREAQACLRAGRSSEETLRRADAAGSFSGPMRTHLVTMLDGIGLADTLGLEGTAQLSGDHHHLAALCSAIDYPVFVNGRNYGGASPPLTRHPVLRSLVRASLGTRVAMTPDALVIPLGKTAQEAASLLAADGLLNWHTYFIPLGGSLGAAAQGVLSLSRLKRVIQEPHPRTSSHYFVS